MDQEQRTKLEIQRDEGIEVDYLAEGMHWSSRMQRVGGLKLGFVGIEKAFHPFLGNFGIWGRWRREEKIRE